MIIDYLSEMTYDIPILNVVAIWSTTVYQPRAPLRAGCGNATPGHCAPVSPGCERGAVPLSLEGAREKDSEPGGRTVPPQESEHQQCPFVGPSIVQERC